MALYDRREEVKKHGGNPFGRKNLIPFDAAAITGEPGTGYEGPESGLEGGCEYCKFFTEDKVSCSEPHMREYSKQPRLSNGDRAVHPDGCCCYRKKGRRK